MNHLGERLSALVDGEMSHEDRDRALSHLASCEGCRFEAEMLRRLKHRLQGLDAPEPTLDFVGRLSAMSGPGDPPPPSDGQPPFAAPPSMDRSRNFLSGLMRRGRSGGIMQYAGFVSTTALGAGRSIGGAAAAEPLTGQGAQARGRPSWMRARYAVAGASLAAVTLSTAFVAGGESEEAPVVTPALGGYAVEHALTTHQAPLPDPVSVTAVQHMSSSARGGGPEPKLPAPSASAPADTVRTR